MFGSQQMRMESSFIKELILEMIGGNTYSADTLCLYVVSNGLLTLAIALYPWGNLPLL